MKFRSAQAAKQTTVYFIEDAEVKTASMYDIVMDEKYREHSGIDTPNVEEILTTCPKHIVDKDQRDDYVFSVVYDRMFTESDKGRAYFLSPTGADELLEAMKKED